MATAWPTVWRLSESSEGRDARVKGRRHDKSTIPPNLASPHDGGIGNHNAGHRPDNVLAVTVVGPVEHQ